MSRVLVRAVADAQMQQRHDELAAFERGFAYPLGNDRFHIDHGRDYLAFFRALGDPFPFVAELDGTMIGVLVAVRRNLDGRSMWYVCDLKVAASSHGRGVARRLLRNWAAQHLDADTPAFAVSMNAADGSNRLLPLAQRCTEAAPLRATGLVLFTFSRERWLAVASIAEHHLGPVHFHDPAGTKDIVLGSTGAPMPLLHAQHGPWARPQRAGVRAGAVHMLCLPTSHPLGHDLHRAGATPSSTATILHRHLGDFDWSLLTTSDI